MPDDQVTSQDDAGDEPGQPATPPEATADHASDGGEGGGSSSAPSSDQGAASEEPQDDDTSGESDEDEGNQAAPTGAPKLQVLTVSAEQTLAHELSLNPERNAATRPPDEERVTFRSVTLAELYVGRKIDALTTALQGTKWVDVGEQFADEIAKARQSDEPYSSEFLLMSGPASHWAMNGYGKASLPDGIQRIIGRLYVPGPSMVALVLTFALTDSEAGRLDAALRDDTKPEMKPGGVKTVYQIKYEHIQALLNEIGERCLSWLKTWALGTLGAGDGLSIPVCSLISLAQGKPFETQGEYMRLLDLENGFSASRFKRPDFLFLMPRRSRKRLRELVSTFNEVEASETYPDLTVAPEILHQHIFPFVVELTLEGILTSFESRMRSTRSDLEKLDLNKAVESSSIWNKIQILLHFKSPVESPVVGLRNKLLALSRDVAIVCGDIKGVIDNNTVASIWVDYPLLVPVDPNQPSPSPDQSPAEAPRKNLGGFITTLKGQETELRELVLVTSEAVSEMQDTQTQKRLNGLTYALVVFTVILVILTGVLVYKTLYPSTATSTPSPTPHTSSPVPTRPHSLHPTPTPSASRKAA